MPLRLRLSNYKALRVKVFDYMRISTTQHSEKNDARVVPFSDEPSAATLDVADTVFMPTCQKRLVCSNTGQGSKMTSWLSLRAEETKNQVSARCVTRSLRMCEQILYLRLFNNQQKIQKKARGALSLTIATLCNNKECMRGRALSRLNAMIWLRSMMSCAAEKPAGHCVAGAVEGGPD